MFKSICILFLFLTSTYCFGFSNNEESPGVFGKLKSGLKLAGQLLGLDAASEVAKLVTESFAKPSRKGETEPAGTNIFSGFFRLLGLETPKVGAIAINALVFLAQLISSSLSRPPPPELIQARNIPAGTPFDWIKSNPKITELLTAAKDPKLPDRVVEYLKERTTDEETGCVQLLICKSAPFLWGMQKAISKEAPNTYASGTSGMYKYLPNIEEIADHGDNCEEKYPTCFLDSQNL